MDMFSRVEPFEWALFLFFLILGVIIGRSIWGSRLDKQERIAFELAEARTRADSAGQGRAQLERDLAAARDQIRPLADEVERLRRENARLSQATQAAQAALAPAAAAAPLVADRAAEPAPLRPARADTGSLDDLSDLRLLKGVGDKMVVRLHDQGVRTVGDMAALSAADAERIDRAMGPFEGRIARDQLIEQARLLVDGRLAEFEARYGRLERA